VGAAEAPRAAAGRTGGSRGAGTPARSHPKFRPPVDLDGVHGKRHTRLEGVQEPGGRARGLAAGDLEDVPPRDQAACEQRILGMDTEIECDVPGGGTIFPSRMLRRLAIGPGCEGVRGAWGSERDEANAGLTLVLDCIANRIAVCAIEHRYCKK
jgi:hypothetical protein